MKKPLVILIFLFNMVILGAQESQPKTWLDWEAGKLFLEISISIPQEGEALPTQRIKAEALALSKMPEFLTQGILNLPLENGTSVRDWVRSDERNLVKITDLCAKAIQEYSVADEDYRNLILRYSLKIYPDLIEVFAQNSGSREPPLRLENRNPRLYTGLIIYAKGPLKVWGENRTARLDRVLLPRIYNTDGELVFDPAMVSPSIMNIWGPVTYATDPGSEFKHQRLLSSTRLVDSGSSEPLEERAYRPLKLVARGVTGKESPNREGRRPDLVLSTADLAPLLSTKENGIVFTEGRILVICDGEVDDEAKKE